MRIKYYILIVLLASWLALGVEVFGDRLGPIAVPPVFYKNLKIIVKNISEDMGVVQAYNVNTNKIIWSKRVYKVNIKPNMEQDTQWVFITKMKIVDGRLQIINELNKSYLLNPESGEPVKDNNSIFTIVTLIALIAFYILLQYYRIRVKKRIR